MQADFTFIAMVLDRSGSMAAVRNDTIGGFNTFLEDQRAQPGRAVLTLAQFDDEYEIVHDATPLGEVPLLDAARFVPRGATALHDAIGRTVDGVGARLAALPEAERPGRVIVVILTDGEENSSKEYDAARVAAMIRHQREVYRWEFLFIGADQNTIETAERLHIDRANTVHYDATPRGTRDVYASLSMSVSRLRSLRRRDLQDPEDS